jgi:ribose 5-phosphate isomerase A
MNEIARLAASTYVSDGCVLGLGSGSAIERFARSLGELVASGEKKEVRIVPSSMQAWGLADQNGLRLIDDSSHCPSKIDVAVDGADQIARRSRSMIKGGGGALLREKVILSSSAKSIILADSSKVVDNLRRSVPIELIQFAFKSVQEKLEKEFKADCHLRKLEKGYPFFTESGNLILDCEFGEINSPKEMENQLKSIPGVVEVGIFNCNIEKFYVGNQDGSIFSI